MSFEVFSLGTSGMMPLPGRFLTSALLRREGELFLFDCGEGTQVSLKLLNLRWKQINSIFISHMHADHVTGLPGLLMLSSQVDRTEPLYIYGPARLADYIESNRKILDMYINYPITVIPVNPGVIIDSEEYYRQAFNPPYTFFIWCRLIKGIENCYENVYAHSRHQQEIINPAGHVRKISYLNYRKNSSSVRFFISHELPLQSNQFIIFVIIYYISPYQNPQADFQFLLCASFD